MASVVKELKKSEEKKDSELSDLKSFISSLIGDGQGGEQPNTGAKTVQFVQSSEAKAEIAAIKLQNLLSGRRGKKSGRS